MAGRVHGVRRELAREAFRHRGLKALYEGRTSRRVAPAHIGRPRDILAALDRSRGPDGMNLLGFRLHELKGPLKWYYAVSVSGNWRVIFVSRTA